jgi:hypothetical protein
MTSNLAFAEIKENIKSLMLENLFFTIIAFYRPYQKLIKTKQVFFIAKVLLIEVHKESNNL